MALQMMVASASGTLGQELMENLHRKGLSFIAASRDLPPLPSGSKGLSLNSSSAYLLEQALLGVDVLILQQPLSPNATSEAEKIIRAAKVAKVEFIVRISVIGASTHSPYLYRRVHGRIDEMVIESGLPYCIVRANAFMQDFVQTYGDDIKKGALFLPDGEGEVSLIDARDVAEFTVSIAERSWNYQGQVFELTGSHAFSNSESMAIISKETRRQIAYVAVTDDKAYQSLRKKSMESWMIYATMSLHRAIRDGQLSSVYEDFSKIMNRSPRKFEDFCAEMKHEWFAPIKERFIDEGL